MRYGGQTSCVEVRSDAGERVIFDAGTGLRSLGRELGRQSQAQSRGDDSDGRPSDGSDDPQTYRILLSHVHWDHIQGLPFFEPAYVAGNHIEMYALRNAAEELHHVITGITRHEFFPQHLEQVPADFAFHEVKPGEPFDVGSFRATPVLLNHPFGAVGYRLDCDGSSVAYISDTAPFGDVLHKQHFLPGPEELSEADIEALAKLRSDLVATLRGTDTVIYDTHFLPEEYERFPHFGHSTPDHALEICTGIDVRRLVLFHHAPGHDDDLMDQIDATYRTRGLQLGIDVVTARERLTLPIGPEPGA